VAAVYTLDEAENMIKGVEGAGGLTPKDATPEQHKLEVGYAESWLQNLVYDMMG